MTFFTDGISHVEYAYNARGIPDVGDTETELTNYVLGLGGDPYGECVNGWASTTLKVVPRLGISRVREMLVMEALLVYLKKSHLVLAYRVAKMEMDVPLDGILAT